MLTNALPPFVFVMRTPTAKTPWDRTVVLAKLVFLEMDTLAKVEEVLWVSLHIYTTNAQLQVKFGLSSSKSWHPWANLSSIGFIANMKIRQVSHCSFLLYYLYQPANLHQQILMNVSAARLPWFGFMYQYCGILHLLMSPSVRRGWKILQLCEPVRLVPQVF